jgi:DNA polymerase/3'-5' exonuclease PolX
MSTSKSSKAKSSQQLIKLYESMDEVHQRSLSEFADFLYERYGPAVKEILPPEDIPRPEQETVVGAIRRLKSTYHMIESMAVFSSASSLMTEHMVKGRDVNEVIDEMEKLFADAYQKLLQDNE